MDTRNYNCELLRYSVVHQLVEQSRWGSLDEALQDGRRRIGDDFVIYDNLEKRNILRYG
jgi:hypothetical protein